MYIDVYYVQIVDVLKLQGQFVLIDDLDMFDVMLFKCKVILLYWEFMFMCLMFCMFDMDCQYVLFVCVVMLIDDGVFKSIVGEYFGKIDVVNL